MEDLLPAGWITDLSHEVLEKLTEMPDGSLKCTEDALGLFRKFIGMVRYEGESYWLYEGLCLSTLEMIDLHYEIGKHASKHGIRLIGHDCGCIGLPFVFRYGIRHL